MGPTPSSCIITYSKFEYTAKYCLFICIVVYHSAKHPNKKGDQDIQSNKKRLEHAAKI